MITELQQEQFFESLINGDRPSARDLVERALETHEAAELTHQLYWPTYQLIERLHRNDKLSTLSYHTATRLLRVLVDQSATRFRINPHATRDVFAVCGPSDADELGAQMAVDILESEGFRVCFSGGGIPNDEIMSRVHETRPEVLLIFAASPQDLPNIRELIDTLHRIGACPNMQIVVGGGVFNRAEGLAEEIGADLWASDPLELADLMINESDVRATPEQRTVGRKRRAA